MSIYNFSVIFKKPSWMIAITYIAFGLINSIQPLISGSLELASTEPAAKVFLKDIAEAEEKNINTAHLGNKECNKEGKTDYSIVWATTPAKGVEGKVMTLIVDGKSYIFCSKPNPTLDEVKNAIALKLDIKTDKSDLLKSTYSKLTEGSICSDCSQPNPQTATYNAAFLKLSSEISAKIAENLSTELSTLKNSIAEAVRKSSTEDKTAAAKIEEKTEEDNEKLNVKGLANEIKKCRTENKLSDEDKFVCMEEIYSKLSENGQDKLAKLFFKQHLEEYALGALREGPCVGVDEFGRCIVNPFFESSKFLLSDAMSLMTPSEKQSLQARIATSAEQQMYAKLEEQKTYTATELETLRSAGYPVNLSAAQNILRVNLARTMGDSYQDYRSLLAGSSNTNLQKSMNNLRAQFSNAKVDPFTINFSALSVGLGQVGTSGIANTTNSARQFGGSIYQNSNDLFSPITVNSANGGSQGLMSPSVQRASGASSIYNPQTASSSQIVRSGFNSPAGAGLLSPSAATRSGGSVQVAGPIAVNQ